MVWYTTNYTKLTKVHNASLTNNILFIKLYKLLTLVKPPTRLYYLAFESSFLLDRLNENIKIKLGCRLGVTVFYIEDKVSTK